MADGRPSSASLRGNGKSIMTPRQSVASAQSQECKSRIKEMTIQEMEQDLVARPTRKVVDSNAPHSARRSLLDENMHLIEEKKDRKALARKDEIDFVEKVLAQDRLSKECEKADQLGKRTAQRELSQYYKAKISEREQTKTDAYKAKVEAAEPFYFPYVEGEKVKQNRAVQEAKQREEMQSFLEKQRAEKLLRLGPTANNPDQLALVTALQYQVPPVGKQSSSSSSKAPENSLPMSLQFGLGTGCMSPKDLAATINGDSNLSSYPRFLERSKQHMVRRLDDSHVRKTLEDKVEQTKAQLMALSAQKQSQSMQWEDGMLVHDAVVADRSNAIVDERKKHAQYLQQQMEERKLQREREKAEKKAEVPGYFGPEAHAVKIDAAAQRSHCATLLKQIETDQMRRLLSKHQRLVAERQLLDHCLEKMTEERDLDKEKIVAHREVLTTTWKSQQKIKEVMKSLDLYTV